MESQQAFELGILQHRQVPDNYAHFRFNVTMDTVDTTDTYQMASASIIKFAVTISSMCDNINILLLVFFTWSILVTWLEIRFLDTEVDGSIPGISMLCH